MGGVERERPPAARDVPARALHALAKPCAQVEREELAQSRGVPLDGYPIAAASLAGTPVDVALVRRLVDELAPAATTPVDAMIDVAPFPVFAEARGVAIFVAFAFGDRVGILAPLNYPHAWRLPQICLLPFPGPSAGVAANEASP